MKKGDPRAFCANCGSKMPYSVVSNRIELTIKGTTFGCIEQEAHCVECNEEVYVPEINDYNVESRETAYRKAINLITIDEVQQILTKYNIGAGPLAILMGFGEVTISRYIAGHIPDREHSEKLLALKSDYNLMEHYLENGKENISPVAYTKCRRALDNLKDLRGPNKIEVVTRYILCKSHEITPLALQKLLYYVQSFFYALFGYNLFTDDCQAWAHGPVYPDIYYKYKEFGYNPIDKPIEEFEDTYKSLSEEEIEFLDAVIYAFGGYSATVLKEMTHNESPWKQARGSLAPNDRSTNIIDRNVIQNYFNGVVQKYNIITPQDIRKYSDDMFKIVR